MSPILLLTYYASGEVIKKARFYRHGAEEAMVVSSLCLLITGWSNIFHRVSGNLKEFLGVVLCILIAVACRHIYRRYGYFHALFGVVLSLGWIPVVLGWGNISVRMHLILLGGATYYFTTHWKPESHIDEGPRHLMRTLALLLVYVTLNVALTNRHFFSPDRIAGWTAHGVPLWFFWVSLVSAVVLPVGLIHSGIRNRDRFLILAGGAMALATICSYKVYFGWARHAWDGMILGTALMFLAHYISRMLHSEKGGVLHGFVASDVLSSKNKTAAMEALIVAGAHFGSGVTAQPDAVSASETDATPGGGGSSGGGGAGGSF